MEWGMVIASFIGTSASILLFILIITVLFGSKIKNLYRKVKGLTENPLLRGLTSNNGSEN